MVTIVTSVGVILCFAGCSGGTPDCVAKDVIACLKSADMDGISKYSTGDFKKAIGMLKGMMESAEDERSESEGRFGEAEPKGAQASRQVV